MKQCSKCKEWKSETEFNKEAKGKCGLSSVCRECRHNHYLAHADEIKQKSKVYYETHKPKALQYAKEARIRNKSTLLNFMSDIKTNCVKCGETRKYIIEFHHIKPSDKRLNVSECKIVSGSLVSEISKCICLCRNCHSEFHYLYGNNPSEPVKSLTEYLGKDPYSLVPSVDNEGVCV